MVESTYHDVVHLVGIRVDLCDHVLAGLRRCIDIAGTGRIVFVDGGFAGTNMAVFLAGADQKRTRLIIQLTDCIQQVDAALDIYIDG